MLPARHTGAVADPFQWPAPPIRDLARRARHLAIRLSGMADRLCQAGRRSPAPQPGGRERAVHRRGGESHQAGHRRRLSCPLAAGGCGQAGQHRRIGRWPARRRTVLCAPGPGRRATHRYRVYRGALASLQRNPLPPVALVLTGARRIAVLEDIVDHGQRRRGVPLRGRSRLRLRAAGPALRRPAVPAVGQGLHGLGLNG
jgi:hypothetical protein